MFPFQPRPQSTDLFVHPYHDKPPETERIRVKQGSLSKRPKVQDLLESTKDPKTIAQNFNEACVY